MEAHHPEYEKHTGNECTDADIAEMAVDRLARNLQFGATGLVNMTVMDKFRPNFYIGDVIKKQKLYMHYVTKYKQEVEDLFNSAYLF